jgi:hypothetical protein
MYSSLMGRFDFVTPIHHIHAISNEYSSSLRFVPLYTSYFNDTWTLPSSVNTSTSFSSFQSVHGVELILPIECEIPSLKLEIELLTNTSDLEERLVHLEHLNEKHQDASMDIKENKGCVKVQYDRSVYPQQYAEGDLVLMYDQAKEPLGAGKFNPMWHGPYIVQIILERGC